MHSAPRLLFLCTGNYYRSRFAEEYWNARAEREALAWRADSRALGVAPDPEMLGTMCGEALAELARLGIRPRGAARPPLLVCDADFARSARAIALDGDEHRPMVQRSFPAQLARIEYWDIGDVWKEDRRSAMERLVRRLELLLGELRLHRSNAVPALRRGGRRSSRLTRGVRGRPVRSRHWKNARRRKRERSRRRAMSRTGRSARFR